MFDDEAAELLKDQGLKIGVPAIREDGQFLIRINNIFMFPADGDDLAHGRATIRAIIKRNEGQVFPRCDLVR